MSAARGGRRLETRPRHGAVTPARGVLPPQTRFAVAMRCFCLPSWGLAALKLLQAGDGRVGRAQGSGIRRVLEAATPANKHQENSEGS